MVIEAKRNFFGLITLTRELQPGDCYALEKGILTSTKQLLEVSVLGNSEVAVQETLDPGSRTPQRRFVGSMICEDIKN